MRRGLTLIETLAAVVLLSMMAAGIVPLLRAARTEAGEGTQNDRTRVLLAQLADRVARESSLLLNDTNGVPELGDRAEWTPEDWQGEPVFVGVEEEVPLESPTKFQSSESPENIDDDPVTMSRVRFSSAGVSVVRWVRVEKDAR